MATSLGIKAAMILAGAAISSGAQARFLQVDPVGHDDQINLYAYVDNDPINKSDPTGQRLVWRFSPTMSRAQARAAHNYLNRSPSYRESMSRLDRSKETYTITGVTRSNPVDSYNVTTRTIHWDPTNALVTKDGSVQSPAVAKAHEITHAFDHDRLGTPAYTDSRFTAASGADGKLGISQAEASATRGESRIARELGDVPRASYRDSVGSTTVSNPTSNSCVAADRCNN